MASGDTKTQQFLDIAAHGSREVLPARGCCNTRTQDLILDVAERIITEEETRAEADQELQEEIDEIRNNPDVVDIVGTYADLQAYDTQHLTDNDIVRVLEDETHDGNSTYYRYSKTNDSWAYIGESKQYDDFVGTDGTEAGQSGLVPAPAVTDAGKFLKADGTWDTAGGANVVQTIGTSTTDVMSQNAVTSMVFANTAGTAVKIGSNATVSGVYGVAIGQGASAQAPYGVAIGRETRADAPAASGAVAIGWGNGASGARANGSVCIGMQTTANAVGSVALGADTSVSTQGVINVGPQQNYFGYLGQSKYRLLTGLYDGQSAHDAATYGQVISYSAINGAGAPTTATEGKYVGQLYYDTTNEAMYFLKTIDTTTTPSTYTWEALGGGPTVVQTTGTSTTDVMSQDAVTKMVYPDSNDGSKISIGTASSSHSSSTGSVTLNGDVLSGSTDAIAIGTANLARIGSYANNSIAIGNGAKVGRAGSQSVIIGSSATSGDPSANASSTVVIIGANALISGTGKNGAIALGANSEATQQGEMNIGSRYTWAGYNNSNYRLISGVYDGQGDHDAVTVGQVNSVIDAINTALSTNIPHIGA